MLKITPNWFFLRSEFELELGVKEPMLLILWCQEMVTDSSRPPFSPEKAYVGTNYFLVMDVMAETIASDTTLISLS